MTFSTGCYVLLVLAAFLPRRDGRAGDGDSAEVGSLPGTGRLDWPEADLSPRLMDGAHRFVERKIAEALSKRAARWTRDARSPEAYDRSVSAQRQRLREIIGAVDPRVSSRLERFGDDVNPALVARTARYSIFQVRWSVLDGVFGEGLLARPEREPMARVVALADADRTPEQLFGLAPGIEARSQFARHLAESGFEVVVPVLVDRRKLVTDDANLRRSDQTHREWIYRQAFHMGRHIIGYEVQTVLAAVDAFGLAEIEKPIGVVGHGEGGLVAFHSAAVDTRIAATLVSGYFDSREAVWSEPIYRNVWSRLETFGDAEIASLVAPRHFVIEHAPMPTVRGQKGDLEPAPFERVRAEFERIPQHPSFPNVALVHDDGRPTGPGSPEALTRFARSLGVEATLSPTADLPRDRRSSFSSDERHVRRVAQLERHVQSLVRGAEHVRDRFFLDRVMPELAAGAWSTNRKHPVHAPEKFNEGARAFRRKFDEEAMGRFDEPIAASASPRTRRVLETDTWTAHDVVLDVWPELFAWGVLVVPKDIRPGERRPVVVCQHGRDGVPRDTIDAHKTAYNDFASVLAGRGFVTFAPHNLYRFEDRYRWLDRKANSIGASLFSFIIAQHDQITRWLSTLSFVDPDRIAFYGLSYGGETAVRVPAILERYCLSICSGDFNQWTRKVAATDQPFSFMRTIEWEMPCWNLGHTFDYAEMAYLIFPRPFLVERGHGDRVGRDPWVAHEYAKVRWLYAQFGLADRTEIEFFQGGHSIHGERSFEFLHHHLRWPRTE